MILCINKPGWVKHGQGRYKDWNNAPCVQTDVSEQRCRKVPKPEIGEIGPFISGYSFGSYTCSVYASENCKGPYVSVDKWGWFKFPRGAVKSFICPCRKEIIP
jgi:hypothetical protein